VAQKTELRKIPGVGEAIEKRLLNLGYTTVASLKGQDPQQMYQRDMALSGAPLDRCLLYVYRLAVYFAENKTHDAEKLKWWNWKD
jgi:hypothetical protein